MTDRKQKKNRNPFHQKTAKDSNIAPVVFPMRLNKYVAKSGLCSRRKAVDLIQAGKVKVNDEVELLPYRQVEEKDVVQVHDKVIVPEEHYVYFLLNKPKNVITTTDDERGRRNVLDIIKWQGPERIFPVGRLDRQTTGLLLLTNDGDLTKKLSHPSHAVKKTYQVFLDQPLSEEDLVAIRNGVELDDGPVPVHEAIRRQVHGKRAIEVTLSIGRNRIVRRLFEHLGYQVERLDRTYFAGLTKKNLPRGHHRPLLPREVIMLKHFT
ncbi:MAG: rRNA pseudouridine synthase [Saprospiraceae bacterium]|nr:rRNA pseudouridine synthase [Saprospiraceae bacterium]